MNLQNLYRATTKDDKCCHKTFRNIQAKNTDIQAKNTERHFGTLKKKSSNNNPLPNKCLNQNYPPQTPFWQLS